MRSAIYLIIISGLIGYIIWSALHISRKPPQCDLRMGNVVINDFYPKPCMGIVEGKWGTEVKVRFICGSGFITMDKIDCSELKTVDRIRPVFLGEDGTYDL